MEVDSRESAFVVVLGDGPWVCGHERDSTTSRACKGWTSWFGHDCDTGFVLTRNPDTVREADVSFIRASRIPAVGLAKSFWIGAPDLAFEALSPDDRPSQSVGSQSVLDVTMAANGFAVVVYKYLTFWLINPRRRARVVLMTYASTERRWDGRASREGLVLRGEKSYGSPSFHVVFGRLHVGSLSVRRGSIFRKWL